MDLVYVLTAIGDVIRKYRGYSDEKFTLAEMPLAIEGIATTQFNFGRDDGYADGIEQGKQAEYHKFWNEYQQNGNRSSYGYAFGHDVWTDETFNPKYPIGTGSELSINYCFYNAKRITRIPYEGRIRSVPWANYNNTFTGCVALKEVWFDKDGVIGKSISFADSPLLEAESIKRICGCLSTTTTGQSVTFHETAAARLTEAEWQEIHDDHENWSFIDNKGVEIV